MSGDVTVFMMDLWATVPYYTAYLSRALLATGTEVTVGSITYYLDRDCFTGRGLRNDPGAIDWVGRADLPSAPRRALKFAEALVNMAALTVRFLIRPPRVVHVQYLPLLRYLSVERWFLQFCRWRGSKLVLTVHDLLPHDTGDRFRDLFHTLYGSMDALICHSDAMRHRLIAEFGIAADRIFVVAHGPFFFDSPAVDTPAHPSQKKDEVTVLWQGILMPYKGVDVLLDAWKIVESKNASARLLVVGTGAPDLLTQVREHAERLQLEHVTLDPRFISVEELVALYRAADIAVYPYRAITTSGALATGLSLGKAILATDLPAFRELLTDGKDAVLVPPGDVPALAEALLDLCARPDLREQLAAATVTKNFGSNAWADIAKQTNAVYAEVLAR